MAKHQITIAFLFLSFFLLTSHVRSARVHKVDFVVNGRVFCDTCRAGFETSVTTYVADAKVRVECRSRTTGGTVYSAESVTDGSGTYNIAVPGDHVDEICESVLVSSPDRGCASIVPGRDRARVVLTSENGILSNIRFANSLGFQKDTALSACPNVMKQYQQY